jgi:hypothetical protein
LGILGTSAVPFYVQYDLWVLQDFEPSGCLLTEFVARRRHQVVLRQSSKQSPHSSGPADIPVGTLTYRPHDFIGVSFYGAVACGVLGNHREGFDTYGPREDESATWHRSCTHGQFYEG